MRFEEYLKRYKLDHPNLSADDERTLNRFFEWYRAYRVKKKDDAVLKCPNCRYLKFKQRDNLYKHFNKYHFAQEFVGKEVWISEKDQEKFKQRYI